MDRCFRNRLLRTSLFGCVLAIGGVVAAPAQSLQVLHSFAGCVVDPDSGLCSGDGSHPGGALTQAGDGNFYATTVGASALAGGAEGVIYRISPSGSEQVVFQFPASVAGSPGVIYPYGCFPIGKLAKGSDGVSLYGVAGGCGANLGGTLFKITTGGSFTKLYDFPLGYQVTGGVVQGLGLDDSIYGATQYGGDSSLGAIFRYEQNGTFTTIHSFSDIDGRWPIGDLLLGSDGNVYGTTWAGGTPGLGACGIGYAGCGTVFRITPTGTLSTLHAFTFFDGGEPLGGLVEGSDGALYGTTSGGGPGFSNGTVFRLAPNGTLTTLHSFAAGSDSPTPVGGLLQASDGNFYGATRGGGLDGGSLFRTAPDGTFALLHRFSGPDGRQPEAGLTQGTDGHLYGTTLYGGTKDLGVVFRLDLPPSADVTAPVVVVPGPIAVEATSPSGVAVTFAVTASDPDDMAGAVTCSPNSGSTFPLGTTTVTCSSTDTHGNTGNASFTVTVRDTIAPSLTLPANVTVDATSPSGAVVTYSASATDIVDGSVPVACTQVSGATFTIGTTKVTCSATDAHGNKGSGSFTVTVLSAAQITSNLITTVAIANFRQAHNLLQKTLNSLNRGNLGAACKQLGRFINKVQAQSGKHLTVAQANQLIQSATDAKGALGCL